MNLPLRGGDGPRSETANPNAQTPSNAERERARLMKNKRQREMWGPVHRRRRVQFARRIERGDEVICPRCGLPVGPDQEWDLGRDDSNPRMERPEHRWCNRRAANQLKTSREW